MSSTPSTLSSRYARRARQGYHLASWGNTQNRRGVGRWSHAWIFCPTTTAWYFHPCHSLQSASRTCLSRSPSPHYHALSVSRSLLDIGVRWRHLHPLVFEHGHQVRNQTFQCLLTRKSPADGRLGRRVVTAWRSLARRGAVSSSVYRRACGKYEVC